MIKERKYVLCNTLHHCCSKERVIEVEKGGSDAECCNTRARARIYLA